LSERDRERKPVVTHHSCMVFWTVVLSAMLCAACDRHCFSAGMPSAICCLSYCRTAVSVPADGYLPYSTGTYSLKDLESHPQLSACPHTPLSFSSAPPHLSSLPGIVLPLQTSIQEINHIHPLKPVTIIEDTALHQVKTEDTKSCS